MKTIKLVAVTEVKAENRTADKKVNRLFYSAEFADPANPFAKTIKRVFWQSHNTMGDKATWTGANPNEVINFIGKEIPGTILNVKVKKYPVTLADGITQQKDKSGNVVYADNVSCVLFEGENLAKVVSALGKELSTETSVIAPKTEKEILLSV